MIHDREKSTPPEEKKTSKPEYLPPTKPIHIPVADHLKTRTKTLLDAPVTAALLYQLWEGPAQPLISYTHVTVKVPQVVTFTTDEESAYTPLTQHVTYRTETEYYFTYTGDISNIKPFHHKTTQHQITKCNTPGLVSLCLISAILNQFELDPDRFGYDPIKQRFINWNFENAFNACFDLRSKVHTDAPDEKKSNPILIDKKTGDIITADETLQALQTDPSSINEKYYKLFKIIFTPAWLISLIINKSVKDQILAQSILTDVLSQINAFRNNFLLNSNFRQYLFENYKSHIEMISIELSKFMSEHELVGTAHLRGDVTSAVQAFNSPQRIKKTILASNELAEYKKALIKSIDVELIRQQDSMMGVFTLFQQMTSLPGYQIIKDRTGDTQLDLKGNTFEGNPVSETFSQIVKVTKLQMLLCALYVAKDEGSTKDLEFLEVNATYNKFITSARHSSWFGFTPVFASLGYKTDAEKILDEAKNPDKIPKLIEQIENELKLKF